MLKIYFKSLLLVFVLGVVASGLVDLLELPGDTRTIFALITGILVYGAYTAPLLEQHQRTKMGKQDGAQKSRD